MDHLILFIHGLNGDSSTFKDFAEFAKHDSKINSNTNVDQWIYPTTLSSNPFSKTSPRVQDLADSLYTELTHRDEKSIILVCHSLGGIIARRMIIDNVKRKQFSKIAHLFLFAVPNEGSDLANVAKAISIWQPQIKQLSPTSDFLDDLNSDWHLERIEKKISITYVIGALDNVVSMKSAKGFWGNNRVEVIPDGDHGNIVKPVSRNDIRYKIFQRSVLSTIEKPIEVKPVVHKLVLDTKPSTTLSCIIVEDELMPRKSLERLCEQHSSLKVVGAFEDVTTALAFLINHQVDIIWLDVVMPGQSGFELLDQLPYMPFVVFTTSKTEYAFDAFQYQVTDYLRKPITLPRFKLAVQKIIELKYPNKNSLTSNDRLYVEIQGQLTGILLNTIYYIEKVSDYVRIVTTSKEYILHSTIKCIEEKIDSSQLLRINRSCIVRFDAIMDIEDNSLVINNKLIHISPSRKSELMNRLNLHI